MSFKSSQQRKFSWLFGKILIFFCATETLQIPFKYFNLQCYVRRDLFWEIPNLGLVTVRRKKKWWKSLQGRNYLERIFNSICFYGLKRNLFSEVLVGVDHYFILKLWECAWKQVFAGFLILISHYFKIVRVCVKTGFCAFSYFNFTLF